MDNTTFQCGDLVRFYPYKSPTPALPDVGIVVESVHITHVQRGYVYEATTVCFGGARFTFPSTDFELIKGI